MQRIAPPRLRVGRGDVPGVGGGGVAQEAGAHPRAPRARVGLALEHEHRRALGQHEAVAARGRRAGWRGPARRCAARAPACSRSPPARAELIAASRAAGHHHVGVAALEDAQRLAERVRRRGAGGDVTEVGAAEPVVDRDEARGHVGERHRDEEGRDAARPPREQRAVVLEQGLDAADAGADRDARASRVAADAGASPASASASRAAASASRMVRSSRRSSFGGSSPASTGPRTRAAICTGERGSKSSGSRATPERPVQHGLPGGGDVRTERGDAAEPRDDDMLPSTPLAYGSLRAPRSGACPLTWPRACP